MRVPVLGDLAQTEAPAVPTSTSSVVGVSVYKGGREIEPGIWDGGNALPAIPFEIKILSTGQIIRGKTRADGFAPTDIPAPPGTEVEIVVSYEGETQKKRVRTGRYPGDTLPGSEFHFGATSVSTKFIEQALPILAMIAVIGVITSGVAVWMLGGGGAALGFHHDK